ncbi:MAG TPA: dihydroneopterin aldolase [Methanothermococcus okinawensis]|uniref:Dihydroneopterin aldolase n=1 Tax=Methanofervidicoccus abyssi TaxID=2082189 RepID=A0A401HRT7_9EURY|nr:dihydroneopterin aldolase family protein [Methanofervidicoccus abyssi]GBF36851.1 dihydroneopterin aldolase [Methanofervidicoccus abyssi]HIP15756.1 dihydroneopterin aldolase [Methanothermococcus okinawensis]HIP34994.1 dihydroneopterin aldolase [Methanothermococcus okinawensis]
MKIEEKDVFKSYFKNLTLRERAVFEGGITLGALFHQFVGTPVSLKNREILERSIEESMKNQPCVEDISVEIVGNLKEDEYVSLEGKMLDVKLKVKVENTVAYLRLRYIKELNYPLMYVERIDEE